MAFEVGSIVEGVVVNIVPYGAFVELADGKTGLVHISEIADTYITDIHPYLKERQQVRVKIIGINEKGKYDLSIKQVDKKPDEKKKPKIKVKTRSLGEVEQEDNRKGENLSFEEKLARFMKESEERLLDLKRNVEAKRGKGKLR
jgi:S1 RNA binding domain protein